MQRDGPLRKEVMTMPTIAFGRPNKKQKLFLMDKHKHVGFGGARGG